jgi:hypothetical protein
MSEVFEPVEAVRPTDAAVIFSLTRFAESGAFGTDFDPVDIELRFGEGWVALPDGSHTKCVWLRDRRRLTINRSPEGKLSGRVSAGPDPACREFPFATIDAELVERACGPERAGKLIGDALTYHFTRKGEQ